LFCANGTNPQSNSCDKLAKGGDDIPESYTSRQRENHGNLVNDNIVFNEASCGRTLLREPESYAMSRGNQAQMKRSAGIVKGYRWRRAGIIATASAEGADGI